MIVIDGPVVERNDGSKRCIGYGQDSEGRVTERFALPSGHEHNPHVETETVKFVESMDDLPPKHDYYRVP